MKFKIEISMDNPAFADEAELPRLLHKLAGNIEAVGIVPDEVSIVDVDGNRVGKAEKVEEAS